MTRKPHGQQFRGPTAWTKAVAASISPLQLEGMIAMFRAGKSYEQIAYRHSYSPAVCRAAIIKAIGPKGTKP